MRAIPQKRAVREELPSARIVIDRFHVARGVDKLRKEELKRRCYGLFNLKHLFQRIYLDLPQGLSLAAGHGDRYMWPYHGDSQ